MRVNFGFLCDHFGHKDGKPSAEGIGLDAFFASSMPVRHPGFDAVISMRFGPEETGEKTVGLGVTDRDGTLISPARYEVINVEVSPGQVYQNKTLKITVAETEFLSFGDYPGGMASGGAGSTQLALQGVAGKRLTPSGSNRRS